MIKPLIAATLLSVAISAAPIADESDKLNNQADIAKELPSPEQSSAPLTNDMNDNDISDIADKNNENNDDSSDKNNEAAANNKQSDKRIVGGISLFVNGEPITSYDIKKAQRVLNTDKIRATDFLIMEKLKDSEIKRLKIEATDSQVDSQINQIAQQNGMTIDKFYAAVIKEGMSLTEYRSKLKEQMLTQELVRKILFSSNVGQEDELRKYYNEHPNEFILAKQAEVTKFVSNDREELESFIKNKDASKTNDAIAREDSTIELDSLPAQIADVVSATDENTFTRVFQAAEGSYVSFYVKKKLNKEEIEFDRAKAYIAQKLMVENQERILNEYFERVRTNSKIEFIR